jgi:ketosteroid isomerase-like protein
VATPDGATALVVTVVSSSTFHAHADQEPARGKAAVRQAFADLFAQFPDLDFTQVSLRTGPDFWVVEWKMSGTLAGTDAGFEVDLVDVITVEGGLVKSKDSYIDAVAMQAQLPTVAAQ